MTTGKSDTGDTPTVTSAPCPKCGKDVHVGSVPLGQSVMRHLDRMILAHQQTVECDTPTVTTNDMTCTCGAVEHGDLAQHLTPCPLTTNDTTDPAWLAEAREVAAAALHGDVYEGCDPAARYVIDTIITVTAPKIGEAIAQAIEAVATDPDRIRPRQVEGEFATDLMNDFEWCQQIARGVVSEVGR